MCGILVLLLAPLSGLASGSISSLPHELVERLYRSIERRGPDAAGEKNVQVEGGEYVLRFLATLLHMRGSVPTPQPLEDRDGNLLLFNGEIFSGHQVGDTENDSLVLLNLLAYCRETEHLLRNIAAIRGPWALVLWLKSESELWFGRDVFGRRSLLIARNSSSGVPLVISSTGYQAVGLEFIELPAVGLFCLKLGTKGSHLDLKCYPWIGADGASIANQEETLEAIAKVEKHLCLKIEIVCCSAFLSMIPPLNKSVPHPSLVVTCSPPNTTPLSVCSKAVQLLEVLQEAVRRRVRHRPWVSKPVHEIPPSDNAGATATPKPLTPLLQGTAGVGVLFSGGLDSAVLAALADRVLPIAEEVDLINVSFVNPADLGCASSSLAHDRQNGLACLAQLNPSRQWNFVEVDTSLDELSQVREDNTLQLIYPLSTVMDDSIGTPVWLAARGLGHIRHHKETVSVPYQSNARILLVGMGADEQLGGYARHRRLFEQEGRGRLLDDIELGLRRISYRNLGRDDRCICDHGKEARFPFLDEEVVSFLQELFLDEKMDLSLPRGVGDKKVLREAARILGLEMSSALPKKAIQFGSNFVKTTGSTKLHAGEEFKFQKK